MHFVHRVRTIWSWLPAFRAVAEVEHLPTAAQELGIVPSSLSRTVKQIEDELGLQEERPALGEPRCVVVGTPSESPDDGWPVEIEQRIVAWASDERSAQELVARSELVTIARDTVVARCGFAGRVTRLPAPQITSRNLHLIQRRAVGRHRRTEALVEAMRVASASDQP